MSSSGPGPGSRDRETHLLLLVHLIGGEPDGHINILTGHVTRYSPIYPAERGGHWVAVTTLASLAALIAAIFRLSRECGLPVRGSARIPPNRRAPRIPAAGGLQLGAPITPENDHHREPASDVRPSVLRSGHLARGAHGLQPRPEPARLRMWRGGPQLVAAKAWLSEESMTHSYESSRATSSRRRRETRCRRRRAYRSRDGSRPRRALRRREMPGGTGDSRRWPSAASSPPAVRGTRAPRAERRSRWRGGRSARRSGAAARATPTAPARSATQPAIARSPRPSTRSIPASPVRGTRWSDRSRPARSGTGAARSAASSARAGRSGGRPGRRRLVRERPRGRWPVCPRARRAR